METKKPIEKIPDEELVDLKSIRDRKEIFLGKHEPLTEEDVDDKKTDSKKAKTKYTRDLKKIEENLMKVLNRQHPLLVDGEVVAWVKDIHYFKLLEMIPDEMLEDSAKEEDEINLLEIVNKLRGEYAENIFKIMAELIAIPEHDWEWWAENSSQTIVDAFNDFLEKRINKVNDDVNFF